MTGRENAPRIELGVRAIERRAISDDRIADPKSASDETNAAS